MAGVHVVIKVSLVESVDLAATRDAADLEHVHRDDDPILVKTEPGEIRCQSICSVDVKTKCIPITGRIACLRNRDADCGICRIRIACHDMNESSDERIVNNTWIKWAVAGSGSYRQNWAPKTKQRDG